MISGAGLVCDAPGYVGCKFEKQRTDRRKVVGEIASGSNERKPFASSCCIFTAGHSATDPALFACQCAIEAPEVAELCLVDHAIQCCLWRDKRKCFGDEVLH